MCGVPTEYLLRGICETKTKIRHLWLQFLKGEIWGGVKTK